MVRLGMVRLADAAPVVHAAVAGLFEAEGVAVSLTVEPSWANIADKLAWGLLDGAVMLPPLAIAMALGLRDPPTPLVIAAGISRDGNAVTLSSRLAGPLLREGRAAPAVMAARLRPLLPLRLAVVHARSTHDLLLRLFIESGGIDPAGLAPFVVVPPSEMPQALASGRIDGFCAGAPWGAVAAEQGWGETVAVSGEHLMPTLMERQLDAEAGALLRADVERRGIAVITEANTQAIYGREGQVEAVALADGRVLPADLVVMAVGIRPNTQLGAAIGLACKRGIVVDDQMRTSDPDVFAVGECIEHRGLTYGLVAPL